MDFNDFLYFSLNNTMQLNLGPERERILIVRKAIHLYLRHTIQVHLHMVLIKSTTGLLAFLYDFKSGLKLNFSTIASTKRCLSVRYWLECFELKGTNMNYILLHSCDQARI
jgi:hypothetical protein